MAEERKIPMNPLDLEYMLTDTEWGKNVPEELRKKLSKMKIVAEFDPETNKTKFSCSDENLWELLAFYNKELRLAYINREELIYCQFWIDLAGDGLSNERPLAFLSAIRRAITVLELSQSKGGFLRNRQQTISTEEIKRPDTPKEESMKFPFKWGRKK